jgi:dihydrofolate reductase
MTFKEKIPALSLIVAVDKEGGFGKDGKIPWFFPEDLKHFQTVTKGGVCIMGRRTYTDMFEMIQSKRKDPEGQIDDPILKDRESYVVTSNPDFEAHGATAVSGIHQAIQCLEKDDQRTVFVIGGERMYIEALAFTQTIYMTVVKGKSYGCDRFFPIQILNKKFEIVDGSETDDLYFTTYKRVRD